MKKVGTQPQKTGKKVKAAVRNSNVELLRLASMFMIVLSHFAIHSPFSFDAAKVTPNSVYVQLTVLGNLGVNIFVLISGYFLYTGGEIRIRRYRGILPLWHGMFFSSAVVYGILAAARLVPFSPVDMVKSCFPLLLEEWWFATTYVMLLLLHPFLNRMLHSLDQRSHLLLLLVFFVTWTCVPTLTGQELKCSDLLWFVNVYCWGAYIKKYRETALKMKASHCFLAAAALYLMFCLSVLAIDGIGVVLPLARGKALIFAERKKLLMFPLSLCLFLGTIKSKPRHWRAVNAAAKCAFGVYLFTENHFLRGLLWETWNPALHRTDSALFIPIALAYCTTVYFAALGLEHVRLNTVEPAFLLLAGGPEQRLMESARKALRRTLRFLGRI